jgi:hypothetical protein
MCGQGQQLGFYLKIRNGFAVTRLAALIRFVALLGLSMEESIGAEGIDRLPAPA